MNILMMVPDHLMIDRRVVQQAAGLVRLGHCVHLLAGFECSEEAEYDEQGIHIHRYKYDWDDERLKRLRAKLPQNDRLRGIVNRLFMIAAKRLFRFTPFETFVLSKAMQFPADVVHVHDLPLLRLGAEIAARRGARLVYDAHEIYYEQECLDPRWRKKLKAEERKHIHQVDLFTTVNAASADYFARLYGVRPLVLLNAAETPPAGFDRDSRANLRDRAGIPHDAHVVLYQGWFSAERNLVNMIHAARFLPRDAYLLLIGYGEFETVLRQELRGKPWEDRVRFLGRVPPGEMLPLTAGADLGVIPYQPIDLNHRLCSPNKFFEFVQAGVPVVAQELPFFVAMKNEHGVVATADLSTAMGFGLAFQTLLRDTRKLADMQAACRKAAATLNWEAEFAKLERAYPLPARAA